MLFDQKQWLSIIAILVSLATFLLYLYRDILVQPKVVYSLTEITEYPISSKKTGSSSIKAELSLALKREKVPGYVTLKHAIQVQIRSVGRKPASNVQIRVKTEGSAYIVQIHTDEGMLVERLPDLGRQETQEVFINIPLMVQGEEVKLTFWYGIPNSEEKPPRPIILVRHADGLGKFKNKI